MVMIDNNNFGGWEMKNNTEEKSLRIISNNIFNKFLEIIKRFLKKDNKVVIHKKITKYKEENKFLDNIVINKDIRLQEIKKLLDSGEIKAKDLSIEDIDKLQMIYDEEIENKKNEILRLKKILENN